MIPVPFILLLLALAASGCAGTARTTAASAAPDVLSVAAARELPLTDGATGAALNWDDLVIRLRQADIVLLGELHDDAAGHAFQRAVVRELAEIHGSRFALALEMLERHEQPIIDDYLDDLIDAETFAELTFSESWAGTGSWDAWYQPIIDEVKEVDGHVIGANAPRRYVRIARRSGTNRLEALDQTRRSYFELPMSLADGHYRERFWRLAETARERRAEEESGSTETITIPADDPGMIAFFRSQSVWDATMGTSTARAWLRDDIDCVALCVGQFHVEYNGGTAQVASMTAPEARILSITMVRGDDDDDLAGHGPVAHVVVRTDG